MRGLAAARRRNKNAMKTKITDDLYDIARRVKEIDGVYDIYYDTSKKRYEIWADNLLQLVVPYDALDARTVTYVRKTRVERIAALMAETEKHNSEFAAANEKKISDEAAYKAKHIADYLSRGYDDIPSYDKI